MTCRNFKKLPKIERSMARLSPKQLGKLLSKLEKQMYDHARNLEFEQAAQVRDRINTIRQGKFLKDAI